MRYLIFANDSNQVKEKANFCFDFNSGPRINKSIMKDKDRTLYKNGFLVSFR